MRRRIAIAWWLCCLALFGFAITGCGGGSHHATPAQQPTVTHVSHHPSLPAGMVAPHCGQGDNHSLGECLPKFANRHRALAIPVPSGTIRCVDLSNNDPIYGVGAWQIIKANGFQCAIFKVNESTGYHDPTAGRMVHDARAAGLFVGGYDFLHVCGPDPGSEAWTYLNDARSIGLLGPHYEPVEGTFPATADSEWPPNGISCNGGAWIGAWEATVASITHREPMTYTGQWWWEGVANIGCWWPQGSAAWISGYTGSISSVPRLCGHPNIDLWQYSDAGGNGINTSDVSVWADSTDQFAKLVQAGPTQAQFASWRRARDSSLSGYHHRHCTAPVLGRDDCRVLAGRVNDFQVLVDAQGQGPRCFGHARQIHAPVCQVVRPAVAIWTRADRSSIRWHNYRVARYFESRISHTLVTSRL